MHPGIEPSLQKKKKLNPQNESKIKKKNRTSEVDDEDFDMIEEINQDCSDHQKDNSKRMQRKEQYENYKKMPPCFEKSVISLLYYITMQSPDLKMIDKEFELLKTSAKIEELKSDYILNSIEKIQSARKATNWEAFAEILEKLIKTIRTLDIKYMMDLFQKVNEAAKSIKDQDVFLLLGYTGVGKSTLTHFLGGSKMEYQDIEGLMHIGPVGEINNPDLKNVIPSPYNRSETRYITPVKVDSDGDTIILCDSPGFEATEGPEVDIACSFGIVTAVKGCKSVKPILILSNKGGDRFEKMKQVAHILVEMIPSIKRELLSFSYIFTKYPPEELKTIPAKLRNIISNFSPEELSDESFTIFIRDMHNKVTTKPGPGPIAIDVINEKDPSLFLRYFKQTAKIEHPEKVFKVSISSQSKSALQQQVNKHQKTIISASRRADFALIKYKMDELQEMNEVLQQDFIRDAYDDCVREVTKTVQQNYNNAVKDLTQCLLSKKALKADDLLKYQDFIKKAEKAELLRGNHLGQDTISLGAYKIKINNEIETLCSEFSSSSLDDINKIQDLADKVKVISDSFTSFRPKYQDLLKDMSGLIVKAYASFDQATKHGDFEKCGRELQRLRSAQERLSDHLKPNILNKYEDAQKEFKKMLEGTSSRFDDLFERGSFSEEDVSKISKVVKMLTSAEQAYTLHECIPVETIKQSSDPLVKKIGNFISQRIEEIKKNLKDNSKNSIGSFESIFSQIARLRKVPMIDSTTSESFYSVLTQLCLYVQEIRNDIKLTLQNISKEGETNYEKLNHNLNHLKSAKWIDEYREGLYQEAIDDVQGHITDHLDDLKKSVQEASLDLLDNSSKLIPTWKKVKEALNMKKLSQTIPNVIEGVDAIEKTFFDTTKNAFFQIEKDYSLEKLQEASPKINLDVFETEKVINYLENSKIIPVISGVQDRAAKLFSNFLIKYSKLVQEEFDKLMGSIINYDQNSFNRDDISQIAHSLFRMLRGLDEIQKTLKTSIYDKYFPRVMESWKSALDELMIDLESRLEEAIASKAADITNFLHTAKILGKVDEFVTGPQKFSNVFSKYSQKNCEITFEIQGKLNNDLSHYKYRDAAHEMDLLKTRKDSSSISSFQKAVCYFNFSLADLIDSAKRKIMMLSPQLKKNELQTIQIELRDIRKAQLLMKDHIKAPEEVKEFMGFVEKTLSSKVFSYLQGITTLLTVAQFVEAETKLSHAKYVTELLTEYLPQQVHDHLKLLIDLQNSHIDAIIKEYTEKKPKDYAAKSPVRILEKLQAAAATGNNPIYFLAIDKIRLGIMGNLDAYLTESKQDRKGTNPFKKLESFLQYVPSDMKNTYTFEIDVSKIDFVQAKTQLQARLREEMNSKHRNLENLKQIYHDSLERGDDSTVFEVRVFIKGEAQKYVERLNNQFQEFKVNEIFNSIELLCNYNTIFEKELTGIKGSLQSVKETLSTRIEELFSKLEHPFQRLNMSAVPEEIVTLSETRYKDLSSMIIKFSREYKVNDAYRKVIPSDLESRYIQMSETIMQNIISINEKLNEGFQKMDVQLLNFSLISLDKWMTFTERIRSINLNENGASLDLIHLAQKLPDRSHVNLMKEKITDAFMNYNKEIERMSSLVIDTTSLFKNRVDEYYQKLNEKLSLLKRSLECQFSGLGFKPENLVRECSGFVESRACEINAKAQKFLTQILTENSSSESREFAAYFNHVCSISENLEIKVPLSIETMKDQILERASKLEQDCNNSIHDIKNFSSALKLLKSLALKTEVLKKEIDYKIDTLLGAYKMVSINDKGLAKLGVILNLDAVGRCIVSDHTCFQGYKNAIFVEKTSKHGKDYVLAKVTGDNINRDRLKKKYDIFFEDYNGLVEENLKPNLDLAPLIAKTIMILGHFDQKKDNILWDISIINNIPSLMAHIFAIWTLQNATHYFEAQGLDDQQNYLLKPHAAQVISIFRMLGIGDERELLSNNLVQIGTGEGKSIVLAVTACVLALCGFEVSCACYSEYLCKRDFEAFRSLFQCLNLSDYIHYGTFNKLCEDVINRDGKIRKIVGNLISTGNMTESKSEKNQRERILLIDEADIFFQPNFYGNVYTPSASLSDPTIQALTDYIWNDRTSNLKLAQVKTSDPYLKCCARFAGWESLIEEVVKDMLAGVKTFESHDYSTKEDRICYKDHTNLVFNVIYGYKTLFAYYKEHPKNISLKSLEENIKIHIKCGSFSYAEIPNQFINMIGVTGTLETLNEYQNGILTHVYSIKKKTFMPSVFGPNNLNPESSSAIKIEKEADYFTTIANEIRKNVKNNKRAVLVFFENQDKLMEFYNSECFKELKLSSKNIQCLTEEASSQEKDSFVRRSTVAGTINLLTRSFGRGTDFVCTDETIMEYGGIHVIQTFLSEEKSEETQIKGRTARQGAEGSYSMVLLDTDLEKFLITLDDIKNFYGRGVFTVFKNFILKARNPSVYDVLDERRNAYFQDQFKSNDEYVVFARKQHQKALEFKKKLVAQDKNAIKEFLLNQNKGVEETICIRPRILCLMDATLSMSSLLQKAKNTVGTMFERANNILLENGLGPACFELQFAVYRNYGCKKNKLLEYSPWETKPDVLRNFMAKIEANGGLGNEAIEIGLWHANQENETEPLQLIILIGDAPPNTEIEVVENRKSYKGENKKSYKGEKYWGKTKFKTPTYYKDEIAKLKQSGVPVHAFYVNRDAQLSFEEIAAETKGRCEFLDINSNQGARMLTDLVTEEILRTVGSMRGLGDKFALAYVARYGKSYV